MAEDTGFIPLAGGCKCGQIRFSMDALPIITHCCHCRDCQKISGSAFSVNAMIETRHLKILSGLNPFEGEPRSDAAEPRCPSCSVTLWSYHPRFGTAIAFVGVGLLDEGERLPPEAHYFIRSKHPWVTLPAGVPSFAELGDAGKAGVRERIRAAMAAPRTNAQRG